MGRPSMQIGQIVEAVITAIIERSSGQTKILQRRAIEPTTDIRLDEQFEQVTFEKSTLYSSISRVDVGGLKVHCRRTISFTESPPYADPSRHLSSQSVGTGH
jgi:hypothetical protein